MGEDLSRRQFFRLGPLGLLREAFDSDKPPEKIVKRDVIRPPGAKSNEEEFLRICERCKKCSEACPHDAILHLGPQAGKAEETPFIAPEVIPCRWCESFDCIEACPSGALSYGPDKTVAPIAKAEINFEACLTSQGILCDSCVATCPSHIRALKIVNRKPVLDEDLCTGCGLCQFYCDAMPAAIRIKPIDSKKG